MIKAVIFDIDNTLYSYDENHIYGMEALAVYCRDSFGITTDEMQACYRKAGRIMTDRIGTDIAAIHSRMLRMQCMLELLEQPLFPHARNMYHAYRRTDSHRLHPTWSSMAEPPAHLPHRLPEVGFPGLLQYSAAEPYKFQTSSCSLHLRPISCNIPSEGWSLLHGS